MTSSWPPYELPRLKAYILAPGVVRIGEIICHLSEDREEQAPSPHAQFELNRPGKREQQIRRTGCDGRTLPDSL